MTLPLYQVDAFTETPFRGNPAGVCLLDGPRGEAWMQSVAAEMNLSETAFLQRQGDLFQIRWFTPKVEVALCGHATLASAHVLFGEKIVPEESPVQFLSKSGPLFAARRDGHIELDFPARLEQQAPAPPGLADALGAEPKYVGRNVDDYLILLEDEAAVRRLRPDCAALGKVSARGVIVTAPASTVGFDFVSRFFAPAAGIDEDPVTGSAHCCLGPFWKARLGKEHLVGYQASARGGIVRVRVAGDRVFLGGAAVLVFRGELVA